MPDKVIFASNNTTDSAESSEHLVGEALEEEPTYALGGDLDGLAEERTPSLGDPETNAFFENLTNRAISERFLSYRAVERAHTVWMDLSRALSKRGVYEYPEPTIGVDHSGTILMSWDLEGGYIECEVYTSDTGSVESETFHENREAGKLEMEEFPSHGFPIGTSAGEAEWLAERMTNL